MIDRLYIYNFRRIRYGMIEFRDGLTVLCGKNGTGKSTAIEALDFNLYGKTKAGTKNDTIRRSGATDDEPTMTIVDMTVNGVHYRCRRYMTRKLNVMASLYKYTDEEYGRLLEQADPSELDKGLGTEVASSTTGVTNAITDLLGVAYDGFCASFVAQQKELDSLVNLTRENRKKFLLKQIGYDRLDDIKKQESQQVRDRQNAIDILKRQSLDKDKLLNDLSTAKINLTTLNGRIANGTKFIADAESKQATAQSEYSALLSAAERAKTAQAEYTEKTARLAALKEELAADEAKLAENIKISDGYDENANIGKELMENQMRLERARGYAMRRSEAEQLKAVHDDRIAKIENAKKQLSALAPSDGQQPSLDAPQNALTASRERRSANAAELSRAERTVSSLSSLIAQVAAGNAAKCPTCGSDISSDSGRAHLQSELDTATSERETLTAEKASIDSEIKAAEAELTSARQRLLTWQSQQSTRTRLESSIAAEESSLADSAARLETAMAYLDANAADAMASEDVMRLEQTVASLAELSRREAAMKAAFYEAKRLTSEKERLTAEISELEKATASLSETLSSNAGVQERFTECESTLRDATATLSKYRGAVEDMRREQGSLESSIKSYESSLETAERQREDMAKIMRELEAHTAARGIIDWLREKLPSRIAPKLSAEASRLLQIATGGAYSMLEIDEEYDVTVMTEAGDRPIAMMSGGEQDIVSLCIRIAIAKMILESTGAGEQAFVLDEIFGALDDERKSSACDALNNLGGSLSRILCITHIDDIKDMADYTYVVEKDENGVSTIREVIDTGNIMPSKPLEADAAEPGIS